MIYSSGAGARDLYPGSAPAQALPAAPRKQDRRRLPVRTQAPTHNKTTSSETAPAARRSRFVPGFVAVVAVITVTIGNAYPLQTLILSLLCTDVASICHCLLGLYGLFFGPRSIHPLLFGLDLFNHCWPGQVPLGWALAGRQGRPRRSAACHVLRYGRPLFKMIPIEMPSCLKTSYRKYRNDVRPPAVSPHLRDGLPG